MIDAATLRIRYPAFAAVPDATISYWLTDAARTVTAAWGDDQEPATLALAAHSMTITPGVIVGQGSAIPAGVTSFKSGTFSVTVDAAAAAQSVSGGYASTVYGREFAAIQRRLFGMPALVGYVEPCGYVC